VTQFTLCLWLKSRLHLQCNFCSTGVWKMVYTSYKKQGILCLHFAGYKSPTIAKLLWEEGMWASRRGVAKFIRRYQQTGTIARKPASGCLSKVMSKVAHEPWLVMVAVFCAFDSCYAFTTPRAVVPQYEISRSVIFP